MILCLISLSCLNNKVKVNKPKGGEIIGVDVTFGNATLLEGAVWPIGQVGDCSIISKDKQTSLFECDSFSIVDSSVIQGLSRPFVGVESLSLRKDIAAITSGNPSSGSEMKNGISLVNISSGMIIARRDNFLPSSSITRQLSFLSKDVNNNLNFYVLNEAIGAKYIDVYKIIDDGDSGNKLIPNPVRLDVDLDFGQISGRTRMNGMVVFEKLGVMIIALSNLGEDNLRNVFISSSKRDIDNRNKFNRINTFARNSNENSEISYVTNSIVRLGEDKIIHFYAADKLDLDGSSGVRAEVYRVDSTSGLVKIVDETIVSDIISGYQGYNGIDTLIGEIRAEIIDEEEQIIGFTYNDRGNLVIRLMRLTEDNRLEGLGRALEVDNIGEENNSQHDVDARKIDANTILITIIYNNENSEDGTFRNVYKKEFRVDIERATTPSTTLSTSESTTPTTTMSTTKSTSMSTTGTTTEEQDTTTLKEEKTTAEDTTLGPTTQPVVIINNNNSADLTQVYGAVGGGVALVLGAIWAGYTKCCGLFGRNKVRADQPTVNPGYVETDKTDKEKEQYVGPKVRVSAESTKGWSAVDYNIRKEATLPNRRASGSIDTTVPDDQPMYEAIDGDMYEVPVVVNKEDKDTGSNASSKDSGIGTERAVNETEVDSIYEGQNRDKIKVDETKTGDYQEVDFTKVKVEEQLDTSELYDLAENSEATNEGDSVPLYDMAAQEISVVTNRAIEAAPIYDNEGIDGFGEEDKKEDGYIEVGIEEDATA